LVPLFCALTPCVVPETNSVAAAKIISHALNLIFYLLSYEFERARLGSAVRFDKVENGEGSTPNFPLAVQAGGGFWAARVGCGKRNYFSLTTKV
jgi:hypothetical protein